MPDLIAQTIQRLTSAGVRFDRGLSDEEVSRVQDRLGFTFGPEHREFLQSAVPVGQSWPDWRGDPDDELRARLDGPIEGVIFDVHSNGFCQPHGVLDPMGRTTGNVKPSHILLVFRDSSRCSRIGA